MQEESLSKKGRPVGSPLLLRLGALARDFPYSQESSTWVSTASLTAWTLR